MAIKTDICYCLGDLMDDKGHIIPNLMIEVFDDIWGLSNVERNLIENIINEGNKYLLDSKLKWCNNIIAIQIHDVIYESLKMGVIGNNDPNYYVIIGSLHICITNPEFGHTNASLQKYFEDKGLNDTCFSCAYFSYDTINVKGWEELIGHCSKVAYDPLHSPLSVMQTCPFFNERNWRAELGL